MSTYASLCLIPTLKDISSERRLGYRPGSTAGRIQNRPSELFTCLLLQISSKGFQSGEPKTVNYVWQQGSLRVLPPLMDPRHKPGLQTSPLPTQGGVQRLRGTLERDAHNRKNLPATMVGTRPLLCREMSWAGDSYQGPLPTSRKTQNPW